MHFILTWSKLPRKVYPEKLMEMELNLTKSSVYASVAFMLQASGFLLISVEITYLMVVVLFMIFRLLMTVTPNKDPLLPLEMPICKILFGTAEPKKRISGGRMENGRVDDKKKH
ncbi:hypothetical protein PoB_005579100 [Plakobranchus ocellatus]|uniref:Uncharacterized protein n=1 Tax=Plakobranchus ocellatus TaxID=259542 RepID=A0AAV4C993_9GAST|nr:hypothetical protein PoB_005579100 [Plakobranchus ocellatus]